MRIKIVGSGGCTCLPRPLCFCNVCEEAREKGKPFARSGAALYIEDIKTLIDTPEDIVESLNYNKIGEINTVLYSHWDPDHTLGIRVFEQLRLNWAQISIGIENDNPINLYALPNVCEDIKGIKNKHGSFLEYYQNVRNLVRLQPIESFLMIGNIKITLVPVGEATIFVFEQDTEKIIYAPCDVKPFPDNEIFYNSDLMIIGNTLPVDTIKDGFYVTDDNPLKEELFVMSEIVAIKDKYNIQEVIMTHLEEDWGLSYTDYEELAKQYNNISFAYDGMIINTQLLKASKPPIHL